MATLSSPRVDASAEVSINHQFRELAYQPWNTRSVARRPVAERAACHWSAQLQHYVLFSSISPRERQEIVSVARYQEISRGKTIYLEGDLAQGGEADTHHDRALHLRADAIGIHLRSAIDRDVDARDGERA